MVRQGIQISIMLGILSLTLLPGARLYCQYDQAEIEYVITKLKERQLLDKLVHLTAEDDQVSATRADVLVACYLVIRELDRQNIAGLKQELNKLNDLVKNMAQSPWPGLGSQDEHELIQRVATLVKQDLPETDIKEMVEPDRIEMNNRILEIEKILKTSQEKERKIEKKIKQNTLVASAAVVISLVVTLFAARTE